MVEQLPWLTILPPVLTIVLAILTRRVVTSLASGLVLAALLVANFHPVEFLVAVWEAFAAQFWADGEFDTYNLFIVIFLWQLGVMTTLMMMAGGKSSLSHWVSTKISSRRGAQGLSLGMAFLLFIDDYFSALAVGQVARPVTDKFGVSRAKLSYIVDSTAAPMTVLVPFSSWGASIIGLLSPVIAASTLGFNDVVLFLGAAVSNYYAIAAVILVIAVVALQLDLGSMRIEERRAITEGKPYRDGELIPGELDEDLPSAKTAGVSTLVVPLVVLTLSVIGLMYVTGWLESGALNPIDALGETMLTESLVLGGLLGMIVALFYYIRNTGTDTSFSHSARALGRGVFAGLKSMTPAIGILMLAWMLGALIEVLGTGEFLAELISDSTLGVEWLPLMLFLVAGFMAFSTGTSWGSFGLLIPIAGTIVVSLGADDHLMVTLGAVLAGAVLGDHISPISDTTILSSTGSQANIITHVRTQLPYAAVAAGAGLVGYLVAGLTPGPWWGLGATVVALFIELWILSRILTDLEKEETLNGRVHIGGSPHTSWP